MFKIKTKKLSIIENSLSSFLYSNSYIAKSRKIRLSTGIAYKILVSKFKYEYIFSVLVLFTLSSNITFYVISKFYDKFLGVLSVLVSLSESDNKWAKLTELQQAFSYFWIQIILILLIMCFTLSCIIIITKILRICFAFSKKGFMFTENK